MKRGLLYLLLLPVIFVVCKSTPVAEEPVPETPAALVVEEAPVPVISQTLYDDTLAEVKLFIDNLNSLIHAKDYNGWRNALSDEFYAEISSPEFLANSSKSPLLTSRRIVLRTSSDYFLQVVVPSRSNSVVDEIEFSDNGTVKAFFIEKARNADSEPRRLRLYELVKIGDTWKIIQ